MFFLVAYVLPLSPSQSQISNWNVVLPHKPSWLLQYGEIWESGKRGKRRLFISNQWNYWETEGGWWIMSPVITKQKGLFLGQLFYPFKLVMQYFFSYIFVIGASSLITERWNCRLYWRYNTFIFKPHHLIITERKPKTLPNTAQLSYIHKNITKITMSPMSNIMLWNSGLYVSCNPILLCITL